MSQRFPVHLLDPAGATDGQVPRYDAATGRVIWASGAAGLESIVADAGSGILLDTTDPQNPGIALDVEKVQDLVAAMLEQGSNITLGYNDATGKLVISAAGGSGGGSGGGVLLIENGAAVPAGTPAGTIIFEKGPTGTVWDFRGLEALPAGWARRGVTSETFDAAGMLFTPAAGQGYQTPLPAGAPSSYTVDVNVVSASASNVMEGAILADGTGLGVSSFFYSGPQGILAGSIGSWTYSSNFTSVTMMPAYPAVIRLAKAGTVYSASVSVNGGATYSAVANLSSTASPTNMGFGSILGSAPMKVASVRYTPATGGSGGLRGWWDGAAVQPFS